MRRPIWQGPPRKFPWPSLSAFSRLFVVFWLFWRFGGDLTEHKDPRQQAPGGAAFATSRRVRVPLRLARHEHSVPARGPSPPTVAAAWSAATSTTVSAASRIGLLSSVPAARALRSRAATTSKKIEIRLDFELVPLPVTQGIARTFQKRPDTKREFCWKLRKLLGRYGLLS